MKYVSWIALLVALAAAAFLGHRFVRAPSPPDDPALVVNGRAMSRQEFSRRLEASSYATDVQGFVDHLVTQELMIQEAQRLKMDQEEPFRASLQSFYEQSLLKALMDRKVRALGVAVDERDVERYRALWGRTVRLAILPADGSAAAEESRLARFRDLSGTLRRRVAALGEGQTSEPFRLGDGRVRVRLDGASPPPTPPGGGPNAEELRQIVSEDAREQAVGDWLQGLRDRASVDVRIGEGVGR